MGPAILFLKNQFTCSKYRNRNVALLCITSLLIFFNNCSAGFKVDPTSSSTSSSSSTSTNTPGSTLPIDKTSPIPTRVQIVLQGQDAQEQSHNALAQNTNHLTIAWQSVSGAKSYNIYRSVDRGAYSLYANVSASTAASAYSSYVSNSGSNDYQTSVDSAYQDTAATNCVGSYGINISNSVHGAPDANGTYFMPNTGYTYKVSAVGSNGESDLSADSIAIFFAGGLKITNHPNGLFNGTLSYKDTGAIGASPLGYTTNAKWTTDATNSYMNPFAGGAAVDGNFSVKGFKYLILNVQAAQDGSVFTLAPELAGDMPLLKYESTPSSTKYGTLIKNQWVTLKIPLSDLLIDQVGGTNAIQYAFYKITLDTHRANETYWIEWYFSVN